MKTFISTVPILNLRRQPIPHSGLYQKDPLQETQILYGEKVIVHAEEGEWVFVEAIEQMNFSEARGWQGYPGWVQRKELCEMEPDYVPNVMVKELWAGVFEGVSASSKLLFTLSMGTKLMRTAELGQWAIIRLPNGGHGVIANSALKGDAVSSASGEHLIAMGKRLLGAPYLWGGRSAYQGIGGKEVATSVDCSGFVNLLYRVVFECDLPRDAHDQYLVAKPKEYRDLCIGDFVFLRDKQRPERISHVMLFAGDDTVLEATMQTGRVQMTTGQEKLGQKLATIQNHGDTERFVVHYGSLAKEFKI